MSIYFEKKRKGGWVLSLIAILVGILLLYKMADITKKISRKSSPVLLATIDPSTLEAKPTLVKIEKPAKTTEGLKASHLVWAANLPALATGPGNEELRLSFSEAIDIYGLHIVPECVPVLLGRVGLGVNHNPFLKPDLQAMAPLFTSCAAHPGPVWYPQPLRINAEDVLVLGAAMNNATTTPGTIRADITLYYKWVDVWPTRKWKSSSDPATTGDN